MEILHAAARQIEIADRLILSGALDVVVIDSVAALVPKGELEGEMGDLEPGLLRQFLNDSVGDLGVPSELMDMGTD